MTRASISHPMPVVPSWRSKRRCLNWPWMMTASPLCRDLPAFCAS